MIAAFLWRSWFFFGLGNTIVMLLTASVTTRPIPFLLISLWSFGIIGTFYGLFQTIVQRRNPFEFFASS